MPWDDEREHVARVRERDRQRARVRLIAIAAALGGFALTVAIAAWWSKHNRTERDEQMAALAASVAHEEARFNATRDAASDPVPAHEWSPPTAAATIAPTVSSVAPNGGWPRADICPYAAARFKKKLESCGFKAYDLPTDELCRRLGYDKMNGVGQMPCEVIETMFEAK